MGAALPAQSQASGAGLGITPMSKNSKNSFHVRVTGRTRAPLRRWTLPDRATSCARDESTAGGRGGSSKSGDHLSDERRYRRSMHRTRDTRASITLDARNAVHRAQTARTVAHRPNSSAPALGAPRRRRRRHRRQNTQRIRTRTRTAFNWTARTPIQRHSPAARFARRCSRSQAPATRGRFSSMLWAAAGLAA